MNDAHFHKLALLGKAVWQTYNVATFDAATIKVPDGGFLCLRQIIYNHFCDYKAADDYKGVLDDSIHSLSVNELGGNDELYYNFRSPVLPIIDDAANTHPAIMAGPTIIETFRVFEKAVCIDIARVPAMEALAATSGKFLPDSEERPSPIGFGVGVPGVNVVGAVAFPAGGGSYFPNGDKRRVAGTAPGGVGYRDQFRVPIVAGNRLRTAPGSALQAAQNMAPFITFGFWKVSGSPIDIAKLI